MARKPRAKTAARPVAGFFRRAAVLLLAAGVLFAGFLARTMPNVSALARDNPETTPFIEWKLKELAREGKSSRAERRFVPYREISPFLKEAVRKSEDFSFFSHGGFDFAEMKQAVEDTLEKDKPLRGASTITMQTARLMYLTPERSPLRKIREALITFAMERKLSKERIFELYLNYADWGNGAFGAEAAARRGFQKSCRDVSCREAAALAAMLPNPDDRDPAAPSRAMRRHIERLLRKMSCPP